MLTAYKHDEGSTQEGSTRFDITRPEVKAMKTLIEQKAYIRLTDDMSGFVCTVVDGGYTKATDFILADNPVSDIVDENTLVLARECSPHLAMPEKQ
jgi:hypothetical protein